MIDRFKVYIVNELVQKKEPSLNPGDGSYKYILTYLFN